MMMMDMSYGGGGMGCPTGGLVHAFPRAGSAAATQQWAAYMNGNMSDERASATGDPGGVAMSMMGMGRMHPTLGPGQGAPVRALPQQAAQLQVMEAKILGRLQEVALRREYADMASTCFDELKDLLAKVGPEWRVRAFGSFANGLCINGSDLDATCYREGLDKDHAQQAEKELRATLLPLLRNHDKFKIMEDIWAARIPVLKLRYQDQLDLDLSCHNVEPLPNTQLLKAYGKLHCSVKNLCVAVKLWAKTAGVCGAKDGNLSSYSITLMVIYFLQVDPQTRVPCLPTAAFNGRASVPSTAKVTWSCSEPLVALMYRFFTFYSSVFHWGKEIVAVRVGQRTSRMNELHTDLRGVWAERLHIADPFLPERNLNCVLNPDREQVLYEALHAASVDLARGVVPPGLSPVKSGGQVRVPREAPREAQNGAVPNSMAQSSPQQRPQQHPQPQPQQQPQHPQQQRQLHTQQQQQLQSKASGMIFGYPSGHEPASAAHETPKLANMPAPVAHSTFLATLPGQTHPAAGATEVNTNGKAGDERKQAVSAPVQAPQNETANTPEVVCSMPPAQEWKDPGMNVGMAILDGSANAKAAEALAGPDAKNVPMTSLFRIAVSL